ncbi:unnamed protein product [Xylocopa violacea]|uniref:RNase H type-1 domain-containing protein n=1 Tax=Xylocopa violacea TaxID=135666 RepID=A0ABP1N5L1_XYLVO
MKKKQPTKERSYMDMIYEEWKRAMEWERSIYGNEVENENIKYREMVEEKIETRCKKLVGKRYQELIEIDTLRATGIKVTGINSNTFINDLITESGMDHTKTIKIYTYGSKTQNVDTNGVGVMIYKKNQRVELSKGISSNTTISKTETVAIYKALEEVEKYITEYNYATFIRL